MAKRVGTAEFEAEVLKEKLPVIVEFYSDSCIPCKQLSPILGGCLFVACRFARVAFFYR